MKNQSIMMIISFIPIMMIIPLMIHQNHMLMSLLSLEGIMLSLVLFIPMTNSFMNIHVPYINIILLSFGVCEAALGLSLMVMMSRKYGSDLSKSLTINKC